MVFEFLTKAVLGAVALALCSCSSAQERAREVVQPGQAWNVLRLDERSGGDRWQVWESDSVEADSGCRFHLKYSAKDLQTFEKTLEIPDCGMTVSTDYKVLPNHVLLADWQSERNGVAYLFRPVRQNLKWIELPYKSIEDDLLATSVRGTTIYFSTHADAFAVDALSFEVVEKRK